MMSVFTARTTLMVSMLTLVVSEVAFDPNSPMTSYWDKGSCGPRGDDAHENTSVCPNGAEVIAEAHVDDQWRPRAHIDGCVYYAYKVFGCKERFRVLSHVVLGVCVVIMLLVIAALVVALHDYKYVSRCSLREPLVTHTAHCTQKLEIIQEQRSQLADVGKALQEQRYAEIERVRTQLGFAREREAAALRREASAKVELAVKEEEIAKLLIDRESCAPMVNISDEGTARAVCVLCPDVKADAISVQRLPNGVRAHIAGANMSSEDFEMDFAQQAMGSQDQQSVGSESCWDEVVMSATSAATLPAGNCVGELEVDSEASTHGKSGTPGMLK